MDKTILVIEDEEDIRDIIIHYIKKEGFIAKEATNGKDGIYIYDVDKSKFYNVMPDTFNSTEGLYSSPIWVSPDKTKVIYMNLSLNNNKEQWNLYAAKINGNSLTSKIRIYNKDNTSAPLIWNVQWSGDSKKILFVSSSKATEKNNYTFYDENQVNIISFK